MDSSSPAALLHRWHISAPTRLAPTVGDAEDGVPMPSRLVDSRRADRRRPSSGCFYLQVSVVAVGRRTGGVSPTRASGVRSSRSAPTQCRRRCGRPSAQLPPRLHHRQQLEVLARCEHAGGQKGTAPRSGEVAYSVNLNAAVHPVLAVAACIQHFRVAPAPAHPAGTVPSPSRTPRSDRCRR